MTDPNTPQRVTVVNFDVSFINLVGLLVKLAIAAIPALVILGVLATLIAVVLLGISPKS